MEIMFLGKPKELDIDYLSGVSEIHKEAERLVKEEGLKQSDVYWVMKAIQTEQLFNYAKEFKLLEGDMGNG